ncbi:heavy-metal-associated domain-containing protein [Pseudogulbenkiania subflava]|uniref:Copper chaperone CopZ n=1 Tax=Pseudogulbenkiania subflava DSM 22618 TaxID=1123014 RepID=A0A1Y6BQU5_9NEIS|nr:heavy-metal-associated domain-containing protein [Pseudogulbenkiania subflava]SMF13542.1 Copper chaperone CopZ [Pseudogulbenkiania subflava DSM 22618]
MEEVVVKLVGHGGQGDERRVATLLARLPGVAQAEAGLTRGPVRVLFNPHLLTCAGLLAVLNNAGFDAML